MNLLDIYKKPANELKETRLTARQFDQVQVVLAYTMMHHGFFANLVYGELKLVPCLDIAVAATDEISIFLNPETYLSSRYTIENRVFIMCHEVVHVIRRDCTMMHKYREVHHSIVTTPDGDFPYEHEASNIALDYLNNAFLIRFNVGVMPSDALYDKALSDGTEDFATVYGRTMKKRLSQPQPQPQQGGQGGPPKPGPGGGGQAPPDPQNPAGGAGKGRSVPGAGQFDEHLSPGAGSGQDANAAAADPRTGLQMAVASAMAGAMARGTIPGDMARILGRIYAPELPWYDLLRTKLFNIAGGDAYDFRKPDRRLIVRRPQAFYAPSRHGFSVGTLAIGVDTSGSITAPMLDTIMFHLERILDDVAPREIWVLWCDAKLQRVDCLEDTDDLRTARCKGAPGGGGTNMNPIFDEIDRLGIEPEVVVIFTDLDIGPVRKTQWPTIWATTRDRPQPYGDRVLVKL